MRTHPTDPQLYLVEPSDFRKDPLPPLVQAHLEPLQTVLRWANDYLCQPHPELGRSGAVCPFVRPSLRKDLFFLGVVPGADLGLEQLAELVRRYCDWFLELEPLDLPVAQYKSISILFPDIPEEDWNGLVEATAERLKGELVPCGMMIGAFHSGPPGTAGLWNPDFRPLRSPVPLLSIRHMVPTDWPFLRERRDWVESYLNLFVEELWPERLVDDVHQVASTFGLPSSQTTDYAVREQLRSRHETIPVIVDLDAVPPELIIRLLSDLDAYHRALGGAGLTIKTVKTGSEVIQGALV